MSEVPQGIMKPIIFNSEMVRAILEGGKTQTRRLIKPQPKIEVYPGPPFADFVTMRGRQWWWNSQSEHPSHVSKASPYKVGDVLYVRETFFHEPAEYDGTLGGGSIYGASTVFAADFVPLCSECGDSKGAHHMGGQEHTFKPEFPKWTPSIQMPRELSRIHLEVTRVRVERACDISEEDAQAEGVRKAAYGEPDYTEEDFGPMCYQDGFQFLWQTIYGPDAWEKWVWVYDFKRNK